MDVDGEASRIPRENFGECPLLIAEVSDKIFMPPDLFVGGLFVGLVTFLLGMPLARKRWWLALIPIALSLFPAIALLGEDANLVTAIVREEGRWHFVKTHAAYAAGFLPWVGLMCIAYRANRRHVRAMGHLCQGCGYSLSGLPTPTCPECGHSQPASKSPHAQPRSGDIS